MKSQLIQEQLEIKHNINSYKTKEIVINNKTIDYSIILTETSPIQSWDVTNISQITINHLQQIAKNNQNHIIIIGTGQHYQYLDLKLIAESKLNIEIMSTKSACHTYTILAQEQRLVVAALIL